MSKKIRLPPLPNLRPLLPIGLANGTPAEADKEGRKKGIPFFRDPTHIAPTRSLYRSLIRATRSELDRSTLSSDARSSKVDWAALRRNVKDGWKKRKGLTSIPQTQTFLSSQRDFLSQLTSPAPEMIEYSHSLATRQAAADQRALPSLARRPYLAGYLRPTHFNTPLPRLKPQPLSISLMIKKRIAARARRLETQRGNMEIWNDIHSEMGLMRRLHERGGLEDMKGFRDELEGLRDGVQRGYELDERRKRGVFGLGVVKRVERARRGRQEWKRVKAGEKRVEGASEVGTSPGRKVSL